ncbi:MAG: hypothetical protein ACPGJV_11720 [Bacteriovoracaceae bacterium]
MIADQIFNLLMLTSNYMDFTEIVTHNLIILAERKEYDQLANEVDNRDRLIKVITKLDSQLSFQLGKLPAEELKLLQTTLLDSWQADLENWKQKLNYLDEKLALVMQLAKQSTQEEIKETFENKTKLEGYNLKNLR